MESNQTQLNKFELFEFFDRAEEYFARKHKNDQKARVRFDVANSVRFGSMRFSKCFKFGDFTLFFNVIDTFIKT